MSFPGTHIFVSKMDRCHSENGLVCDYVVMFAKGHIVYKNIETNIYWAKLKKKTNKKTNHDFYELSFLQPNVILQIRMNLYYS